MGRTLAERAEDPLWWLEQALHAGTGFTISFFCLLVGIPVGLAVGLGCYAAAARETLQNHGDIGGSLGDSLVDQAAWMAGAVIAAIFA